MFFCGCLPQMKAKLSFSLEPAHAEKNMGSLEGPGCPGFGWRGSPSEGPL